MKKRYYIAYGSNLHRDQMRRRCPGAKVIGTSVLDGYRLMFKGSGTGAYLTIEPRAGRKVPVAVYLVTEEDEKALDRYEGYPRFYYKEEMTITVEGICTGKKSKKKAFVYIMDESRDYGLPSRLYLDICSEGYRHYGFDTRHLWRACRESERETWKSEYMI